MGEFEYSIWIEAAPDVVWPVYVDPTRLPDWQTGNPVIVEVHGEIGAPGSSYVSRRGRLAARTTVLSADIPRELVTRTEAYAGLQLEVISRLSERAGGTDLHLHASTRWKRGIRPLSALVELIILGRAEARKELGNLKALVEQGATG